MEKDDIQQAKNLFGERIQANYKELISYYEHDFICFIELSSLIEENIYCLLLGLYQASIFTTNHILEHMLKHALLNFDMIGISITPCSDEYSQKVEECKQLYDANNLWKNIQLAFEKNIISDDERDLLGKLRDEFRNPYSHAQRAKIIKDSHPIIHCLYIDGNSYADAMNKCEPRPMSEIQLPTYPFAPYIQKDIAYSKSKEYFKQVFEIMGAIDKRYKESK